MLESCSRNVSLKNRVLSSAIINFHLTCNNVVCVVKKNNNEQPLVRCSLFVVLIFILGVFITRRRRIKSLLPCRTFVSTPFLPLFLRNCLHRPAKLHFYVFDANLRRIMLLSRRRPQIRFRLIFLQNSI